MTHECCAPSRAQPKHTSDHMPPVNFAGGLAANPIRVKGGRTFVGTTNPIIREDGEGPPRTTAIRDFVLEEQAVTVVRFAEFVAATGYITEAEEFGWSVVFVGLLDADENVQATVARAPWWARVDGANWREPEGPGSSVAGRQDHPVTQVSWRDANAFAKWAGGRLPTEAEWEHAARGGARERRFAWGNAEPDDTTIFCNIWQGHFPDLNTCADGYRGTAPTRSFRPSPEGFYNLCGNVWEWTADPFKIRSVSRQVKARNAAALRGRDKVLKGGSFLCHPSYCYRYRIAARMNLTPDSAASNVGFRVAYDKLPFIGECPDSRARPRGPDGTPEKRG